MVASTRMVHLPQYRLSEQLYGSADTVVYRAQRLSDGLPVVIKQLRDEYPRRAAIERLRHEYATLTRLAMVEVARALTLEPAGNGLALVLEDSRGEPVEAIAGREGLATADLLRLFIGIARAVRAVHAKGVIHKDLKPAHLLRVDGERVTLIDFGLSTQLAREHQAVVDLDLLEGTLPYVSPEQTGRINRAVDQRSDLYSLGVTFFELATGRLPFASSDPLELVHCHIAKSPPRADRVRPSLPPVVGAIIEKLMAKVPEDRYQSAAGLLGDLERCLAELDAAGAIAPFALGSTDLSGVLRLPQKLYGRSAELAALRETFKQVCEGNTRLVLLAGPSGVGKSALVHELRRHLVVRGHFASGKFDQLGGNAPYPALADACRERLRAMLREPEASLASRRRALLAALGANVAIVSDVVPELALIVGACPPPPPLGPSETRHRFEGAFEQFLSVLVTSDEPLVMFLDDLQWADPASLRLLRKIVTAPGRRPLLLLAAFRDHEVSALHPLRLELDELSRLSPAAVQTLHLDPLGLDDVADYTSDALSRRGDDVRALATVLHEKTQGNPFHLGQFLQALARDGTLRVDGEGRRWVWDLPTVAGRRATENVVALVVERLHALAAHAQVVLSIGACIGYEFDSDTLAAVADLGREALVLGLEGALTEGMLVGLDGNHRYLATSAADARGALNAGFRFVHDRVQQAAYGLLDDVQRAELHLKIGRHLRQGLGERPLDSHRFAAAQQLNRGLHLIDDPEERRGLAELNLTCALKARASGAAAVALDHLGHVLELTGAEGWSRAPKLLGAAHLTKAECEYLCGAHPQALTTLEALDAHATELLDRVAARNLRALVHTNLGAFSEACQISVTTLRLLGVDMPDAAAPPSLRQAIEAEFGALQLVFAGKPISTLKDLPELSDPLQLARLGTIGVALPAAYQSNQDLMVLLVLKGARLSLLHGATDATSFFLVQYALAHLTITGDHAAAHQLGRAAVELGLARPNVAAVGPAEFVFAGFISHWCDPMATSLEHFGAALRRSLEVGDLLHAAYCVGMGPFFRLFAGHPLGELKASLPAAFELVDRMGNVINRAILTVCDQLTACLTGQTDRFGSLSGGGVDEAQLERQLPPVVRPWLNTALGIARYHAGDHARALEVLSPIPAFVGSVIHVELQFHEALTRAALARAAEGPERERHLARLAELIASFVAWAKLSGANQAHRLALLRAEEASLTGALAAAMDLYEEAIASARSNGFLHHQALAGELCGDFHLRSRRPRVARAYLADATRAYDAWGASGKVTQLISTHPELDLGREIAAPRSEAGITTRMDRSSTSTSTHGPGGSLGLDLESAIRATQAFATELDSDRLLDRLLRLVVENAGAQRGVLLLPSGEDLAIEAERTVEPDEVRLRLGRPIGQEPDLPASLVRYVARTRRTVVSGDPGFEVAFGQDDELRRGPAKSVLCLPLVQQGVLSAVLYLENRAAPHVFGPARVERIQFLAGHAASALENARLFAEIQTTKRALEVRVRERTQELSQRNSDLHGVLDAVSQGLVTLDREGRVVGEVSAKASAWFGPIDEQAAWHEVLARVDAVAARAFCERFSATLDDAGGAVGFGRLPKTIAAGGRALSLELRPVGEIRRWSRALVVISDVTDEARQRQLELELRHAQKLESVGQLAAGIAHEINTPTQFVGDSIAFLADSFRDLQQVLTGYRQALAELAAHGGAAPILAQRLSALEAQVDLAFIEENAPSAFDRAVDGVSRIATLVGAMKEFAHPDRREKTSADLNRALRNTLIIARNEYKHVADVETELGELPPVMCHLSDMNQVFLNLLINAAHAVSEVVGNSGRRGHIWVRSRLEGDTVRVEVEDTGCGIPEAIRDRVFDPFFTTKDVGRGSGQGLAIARSIVVDKHRGTLTFRSTVGEGSTFTVLLPVGPATAVPPRDAG